MDKATDRKHDFPNLRSGQAGIDYVHQPVVEQKTRADKKFQKWIFARDSPGGSGLSVDRTCQSFHCSAHRGNLYDADVHREGQWQTSLVNNGNCDDSGLDSYHGGCDTSQISRAVFG